MLEGKRKTSGSTKPPDYELNNDISYPLAPLTIQYSLAARVSVTSLEMKPTPTLIFP